MCIIRESIFKFNCYAPQIQDTVLSPSAAEVVSVIAHLCAGAGGFGSVARTLPLPHQSAA